MNKKIITLIALVLLLISVSTVCFAAPPSDDYKLILADEFDGTELNRDIWDYRSGNPYGGKNLKENVRVKDGMLYLDYRKTDGFYTGGGVLTPFTLPYGYYEVEAKVYNGANGLHTSFWTSGGSAFTTTPKYMPHNNCFIEIDVFEIDSREDDVFPNIHHGVHNWCGVHTSPFGGGKCAPIDASADFFVMGMEWLPDQLNYYINGELVSSYKDLSIYGPSFMWLTAVAMPEKYDNGDGTFAIDDSKMDENGYFGSSLFKYFRYYQRPLKNVNLLGNGNFEYNKVTSSIYPSTFFTHGTKSASYVQKSPLSYDGFCYHTHQSAKPYSLKTGQEFAYLYPGKYTFKGQFKATEGLTTARLVVFDKEENVIASKDIPVSDDWTEVSLTDIQVDGYAVVAVESASEGNTMLSMDALEFFIQDGEEYTAFNTPLYETSMGVDSMPSTTYILDDAVSYTGQWSSSGLEEDTYYLSGSLRNVEVNWEIPASETDSYRIELRNIIHENNTAQQTYYITTPDGTEHVKTIDTKNGETSWVTLGTYPLKEGEVLKVSLKANNKNVPGHVRVTSLKVSKESDYLSHNCVTMQLDSCVFSYKNTPYAYDKENQSLTPYKEGDTYYIPYQKLKKVTEYKANIDENSVYVTTKQLEDAGYGITISGVNIFIHEKDANFSQLIIERALDLHMYFVKPYFPVFADYVGTENRTNQIVKGPSDAVYTGNDWLTSTHNITHKYTSSNNCTAEWYIDVPADGEYMIDFYSPSHPNSTTQVTINIYTSDLRYTHFVNQTEQIGWYNLGELNLKAGERIKIQMKHTASGFMRVGKMRIAPLSAPDFVNDKDALNQEYYNHTTATKVGSWQNSSGVYEGCCTVAPTEENKNASITWNVTPLKNTKYSLQIYVPKYTNSGASSAEIEANIDGKISNYVVYQCADSPENTGNGWYEIAVADMTTSSNVTVKLSNPTLSGWLRAKAIRLVPISETPVFVNDSSDLLEEYYGRDEAVKVGEWINSAGDYKGCIASLYSKSNENASVNWTVNPKKSENYDIQVYIPRYTTDAAELAGINLEISGKFMYLEISEHPVSEENTGAGWYSLGKYNLTPSDEVSITLTNASKEGWLRAKAVRLVSEKAPVFVGNTTENGQELFEYSAATTTGSWRASTAIPNITSYYGSGTDALITWNPVASAAQKYSIQVFIPHHTSGSTNDAYVTITIDGVSHTFSGINQNSDPADGTGWYDFGIYNLTPDSEVTVKIGKNSGTYLRAKDIRLVPLSNATVTKSGKTLTINTGVAGYYAGTIILAEYKNGALKSAQILEPAPTITATMTSSLNKYRIFFWQDINTMIPLITPIGNL